MLGFVLMLERVSYLTSKSWESYLMCLSVAHLVLRCTEKREMVTAMNFSKLLAMSNNLEAVFWEVHSQLMRRYS
jgi:hypothetical protein